MMSDSRDSAIKLFGKTIALPSAGDERGGDAKKDSPNNRDVTTEMEDKEQGSPESEEKNEPAVTSSADETQKPNSCCDDQETASEKGSKAEEQQSDSADNNQQEKTTLKKPDKILPCPRCNSMDTKFCYYNNYNVNQPRHFCKNCQRYWTAGGSMRNVPVGAGRRKNKNSAANHYRHLTMTDAAALQAIPDSMHHPALQPNGTVLSFGSDTPLCESMASVLDLAENAMKSCSSRNEFDHIIEGQMEEQSSGSSATASNLTDEGNGAANLQEPAIRSCQGFPPHLLPYINGSPWPYLWSPPPPGAAPFWGSSFRVPIHPATAYWGCSTWSIPWLAPPLVSTPIANGSSGPTSPTLGKHSRDGDVLQRSSNNSSSDRGESTARQSHQEKCLWIPKTLRIHDPEEAAKSSIWATMGFNNDKADGISSRGGLFKSFQTKAELNNHKVETCQLLHANPAALSRSVHFQESS